MILTDLLFEMPMINSDEAISDGLCLYVGNPFDSDKSVVAMILYYPKDTKTDNQEKIVGYLSAKRNNRCPEFYEFLTRGSDYGFGPLMLDMFLTIVKKPAMPDRDGVSVEAQLSWEQVLSKPDKYEIIDLPHHFCGQDFEFRSLSQKKIYQVAVKIKTPVKNYKQLTDNHDKRMLRIGKEIYASSSGKYYQQDARVLKLGQEKKMVELARDWFSKKYQNRIR
jgi:hypothetical protein